MDKEAANVTKGTLAAVGIFLLVLIGLCAACGGGLIAIGWFTLT